MEEKEVCVQQTFSSSSIPLSIYKKDVDIFKNLYGLSVQDVNEVEIKLNNQKQFLRRTFLKDNITQERISLEEFFTSSNHNSHRYYAELQNRINTLNSFAEEKNLYALFLTLTLGSEYHEFKKDIKSGLLVPNKKFNGTSVKDSVKILTSEFSKLRHDRSLKQLSKEERIYFRVNEPHKNGTPHTHVLLYVPKSKVNRIVEAFNRIYNPDTNKIKIDLLDATPYIMKYLNKTLPSSKQHHLSWKDKFLNTWYIKNRIIRFNSSKTLAPLSVYRKIHNIYSLKNLTNAINRGDISIICDVENPNKIFEILDGSESIYLKNLNFEVRVAS
ncbi:replication endonuclease [Aliarcobacter butzleri]|uniref:replication endonuclease n=1 Tax=Aliarcobacter butzleri TaxID=28197 RepID=UPI003B224BE4